MTSQGDAVGSQGSYEGISDLLKCYICFDSLKDAVMCPHCSKIACHPCIKKWIMKGKPECPHCRARILDNDLIRVPSVQDLSDFIGTKSIQSTDKEFCSQHPQLALTVYCETCHVCICSDCALWGNHRENQGHSIKPLEDLYKLQKRELEKKLSKLQDRLNEILSLVEHIEVTMNGTKSQRNKTQQEIDKVVEDIFERLNDQLRMKLQKLTDGKRFLKRQACQITNISTEIEGKIRGSQSLIVSQREELQEKLTSALKELESSKMTDLEVRPEVGTFVNEIVPPYETAVFEIKDFCKKQQAGKEIFSNQLSYCGLSWRLKVYPNGTEDFTGRYLGVFVELYDGYSQTCMYNYFVEMVHGAGHYRSSRSRSGNFKRDYASDFAVGEAWGYKKFYDLRNLEAKGFLVKDTLLLKFGVRHPTFHQKCRDCILHINDLKHKIMSLKYQNSQLRHKCEGISDETDEIGMIKMKNKTRKVKSPKDIHETLEEDSTTSTRSSEDKKASTEKRKQDKVIDETKTREQPLEEQVESESSRMTVSGGGVSSNSSGHFQQPKLGKSPMSLSQPHLHTVHDSRMQHRMEKENSRRALHHTQSFLSGTHGQRTRQQQQQQGVNYGHCIAPHRRKPDNPDGTAQTLMEQRRQSYDPSRLHMYDQSQSMMLPQHLQIYPGSLSQADYMMMPSHRPGGDYYTTIRENPTDPLDWMGGMAQSQSSPRRQPHPPRNNFMEGSQTDISYFMDDPGSPGTLNGEPSSQLGPPHNFYNQPLSQELHDMYDMSDIMSMSNSTMIDDSGLISQKVGYGAGGGMIEMSQPVDHMAYVRKKSNESSMALTDMDISRSMLTLHNEGHGGYKGSESVRRKPTRTHSTTQRPTQGGHIKSMGSEPQLNMYGPPGLQSSMLPVLATPVAQLRTGSSSTLPHSMRGKPSHHSNSRHHHKHSNSSAQQHSTSSKHSSSHHQQQQMNNSGGGNSSMTQPNLSTPPSINVEDGSPEQRRSSARHDRGSSHNNSNGGSQQARSSLFTTSAASTTPTTSTSSPSNTSPSTSSSTSPQVQQRMEQQSPNNQKLRASGRSYKLSKKYFEGRSSPSKSAQPSNSSSAHTKQTDHLELTLETKSSPSTESSTGSSNRLAVGGNIVNNTSLSQLDML